MAKTRRCWLLKSEPGVFSFDDLWKSNNRTTFWDGVRNYQARNLLRAELRSGDEILFYHSSCDPPGVAGIARVMRAAVPDPTQFDPRDPHFDPESSREAPRWYGIEVQALRKLPRFVSLEQLRGEPRLAGMGVLRPGNRLSVQPVSSSEWKVVMSLGGVSCGGAAAGWFPGWRIRRSAVSGFRTRICVVRPGS